MKINNMPKENKLKPVVFSGGRYRYHQKNLYRQNLLLKAMQITSDPKKMRQIADIKSVTEFYREMDKLHIRKEYHNALINLGVDFNYLVGNIKSICDNAESDAVRLKGLEIFLKSIGLDQYKDNLGDESKKSWEDYIMDLNSKENSNTIDCIEYDDYNVIKPEVPEDQMNKIKNEIEIGKNLYE